MKKSVFISCADVIAYVIGEVERVVAGVGEDLVKVVELSEHGQRHFTQHRPLHAAVLDLLQLQEVLRNQKQILEIRI